MSISTNLIGPVNDRIHGPDVVRGLSAAGVVFFHVLYISGVPIHEVSSWWVGRFDFFVRIFFVLSAFAIANAYRDRIYDATSLSNFYVKRFFRIAPLFYFVIGYGLIYRLIAGEGLPGGFNILLSLSFLFPFVPGMHESLVGGGWSIGIEWIFYVFFPIAIVIIRGWRSAVFTWLLLCTLAILGRQYFEVFQSGGLRVFGLLYFLSHAHYFVIGLWLALIYKTMGPQLISRQLSGVLFILTIFLVIVCFKWQSRVPEEIFLSVAGFFMVYLSLVGFPRWLDNRVTRQLGLLSYSIYLLQFPVIQLLVKLGFYGHTVTVFGGGLLSFFYSSIFTLFLTIAVSSVTYRLIEVPGQKFGDKWRKRAVLKHQSQSGASQA